MEARPTDVDLEVMVHRIMSGQLDLQPDFQRGEVWDLKRRQRLIDTLLREWYVPAVHIVQDPDRRSMVLDGQQRLVAIRDFFSDQFPVDGSIDPIDPRLRSLHGLRFSQLPQEVVRGLKSFPLPVVYLRDYTPGEPNELFFRLNQSYNLTPPEKRNALYGPARNQVKDLVDEMIDWGLLTRESVGFSNQRLAFDDIVARACVAVQYGTLRKHINNNVVEDFYRIDGHAFDAQTISGIREAGRVLHEQIQHAQKVKFNKGTLQTWLIYCYWAPRETGPVPPPLLAEFEIDRSRVKRREPASDWRRERILNIVSVYDDRASYRVTDVSSVVARDAALHLYSEATFGTSPRWHSSQLISQLNHEGGDPKALIFEYLEGVQWGSQIVGKRHS